MYDIPDGFLEALKRPHTYDAFAQVRSFEGETLVERLPITDGSITIDEEADIRRRARLTVIPDPDGDYIPSRTVGHLHPFSGNELHVFRSVNDFPHIPVGVFGIRRFTVEDSRENFHMSIEGGDRSQGIQRRRFINNYHIEPGDQFAQAIMNMIDFKMEGLTYDFDEVPQNFLTPKMTFGGSGETGGGNAWDAAIKMAESIGFEIFFDVEGVCVMRKVPDISQAPVVDEYQEGPYSRFMYLTRAGTNQDTYSHVVVYGESSSNDEPVHAHARDEDPLSPTYIYGPFGDIPFFFRNSAIRTQEQAQEMANAQLRRRKVASEDVRMTSIPNPAMDVGDVVRIVRDRSKVGDRYIVKTITLPLGTTGSANVSLRRREFHDS